MPTEPLTRHQRHQLEIRRSHLIRSSAYAVGAEREAVNTELRMICDTLNLDDIRRAESRTYDLNRDHPSRRATQACDRTSGSSAVGAKTDAIRSLLQAGTAANAYEIARVVGCHHSFVRKVVKSVRAA